MIHGQGSHWREQFARIRNVPVFDRVMTAVRRLSPGDKVILYVLAGVAALIAFVSIYALEQSLLVTVPTYGGTLTEGEVGNPQFINPLLAISDADRDLSTLTYAGLMGVSGSGKLVPVLAKSYTISPDGKTYTFTLRKNAVFTDGSPVTASDVVFTVRKAQDPALKSPEYADWSGVQVVAVNAQTVRFTLSKPYAPFLSLTTLGILPAHLWQNTSDTEFPFSSLEINPVGNGPFMVGSVSRDASGLIQSVSLVANPRYVLGRPYLDGITFVFYANSEDLANALASGAVESAYGISSPHALSAPYARVFGVFFNPSQKQVFANLAVRKALSLSIDRAALVTTALGGNATPIMGPVPPGEGVRQASVPDSADPTAVAAKILEDAGWSYDGSMRAWTSDHGKQVLDTITLRTSNVPEMKAVATAVQTAWQKLGVSVNIELYEPGDLSQNVIRPRKYDALLYGEVIGRDQDLYAFWDSQERNDPGLNIALYANKTVDALLENARSTTDPKTRLTDLQKIEDTVSSEYPAAFLYAPNFVYTVPKDLRGVALPQIITPSDRFASVASWYRYTDAVWPFFSQGSTGN